MDSRHLLALVTAASILASPDDVRAGGFSSIDFGSRRMGSFAVVGRPDDVTAIFHNPAGLTLRTGTELYVYGSAVVGDLAMRLYDSRGVLRPDHAITPDFNFGALPFLGVTSDLGTKRWRVGLGVYVPNALGAAMPDDEPTRYHVTDVLFVAGRSTLAGAFEVSDRWSVGASVSLVYTFLSASRVMSPLVLADPDQRFAPLSEAAAFDHDLTIRGHGVTWAWDAGLLFHPLPSLRLGAVFASGSPVGLEGEVTLTGPDGAVEKGRHHTRMVLPFTLKAGLNWEFAPDFEVGLDVVYWHYQVFQEQWSELSEPLLGLVEFRDPKDFGNSVLWNIGLVHRVLPTLEVMTGFQMDFTPTPTRAYALESPARDSLGVALGARWQVTPGVRAGLAFNRIWFALTDVQDSLTTPPTNAKGYGGMLYFAFDVAYRF